MLNANEVGYQSQSPSIITDKSKIFPIPRILHFPYLAIAFLPISPHEISPKGRKKNGFYHYPFDFSGSFAH